MRLYNIWGIKYTFFPIQKKINGSLISGVNTSYLILTHHLYGSSHNFVNPQIIKWFAHKLGQLLKSFNHPLPSFNHSNGFLSVSCQNYIRDLSSYIMIKWLLLSGITSQLKQYVFIPVYSPHHQ